MKLYPSVLWLKLGVALVATMHALFAGPKIGILIGDATSPFGQSLVKSFRQVAEQRGVEVVIKAPLAAENIAQSTKLVTSFTADADIKGVLIACGVGAQELAKAAEPLQARGVIVVSLLGRLPGSVAKSAVLIDEETVIATAVEKCLGLVSSADEVALLRSNIKQQVANDRERLVIDALKQRYPQLAIHADIFMNVEGRLPVDQAKLLLEKYPGTKLVYSPYSTATLAMIQALRETGRSGKIRHVGVGAGLPPECEEAVATGSLDAWIALDADDVAQKAVDTMVSAIDGRSVSEVVFSKVKVVTPESLKARPKS